MQPLKERSGRALYLKSLRAIGHQDKWTKEILIKTLSFDSMFLFIYIDDKDVMIKLVIMRNNVRNLLCFGLINKKCSDLK